MTGLLYQKERDDLLTRELAWLQHFRLVMPEMRKNNRELLAEIRALATICRDFSRRYEQLRWDYQYRGAHHGRYVRAEARWKLDGPQETDVFLSLLEEQLRLQTAREWERALYDIHVWLREAERELTRDWPPHRLPASSECSIKEMERHALRQLVALAAKHGLTREQLAFELDNASGALDIELSEKAMRSLINHFGKKVGQK